MVRHRELELLLPQIEIRGVHTQVVTSAFRQIPTAWKRYGKLNVVVSVDGLQPEHDARRKPATYERVLRNIEGATVTVHCTITSQIADRPGYLDDFLSFWTNRRGVAKVWFSIFTPQRGATDQEILTSAQRASTIADLRRLRLKYARLDMPEALIRELEFPPKSPEECIFARTTQTISADLRTRITPCQFGGNPDCERCGCIASMGLAAVGHHHVVGRLTAGHLFRASDRLGRIWRGHLTKAISRKTRLRAEVSPFNILKP